MKKTVLLGLMLTATLPQLQGCAAVVAGGAVTTATVARDQRTAGTILDDSRIESKAADFFNADAEIAQQTHISVLAHNGMVLLVGQAPTDDMKKRAVDYVSRIAKVRHIYDELTVQAPIPTLTRTNDGLITTKVGTLETKDDIKRRLDEASKYVSLDQVCLSPQCGFSSTVHGNDIARESQAAKIKLVVDVARDVWGGV